MISEAVWWVPGVLWLKGFGLKWPSKMSNHNETKHSGMSLLVNQSQWTVFNICISYNLIFSHATAYIKWLTWAAVEHAGKMWPFFLFNLCSKAAALVSVQDKRCSEERENEATTTSTEHCRDATSGQFRTWYVRLLFWVLIVYTSTLMLVCMSSFHHHFWLPLVASSLRSCRLCAVLTASVNMSL